MCGKCPVFFHTAADRFQAGGQALLHCEVWQITYRNAPKKYVFSLILCNILNILYFKYLKFSYHRCRPTWNQCGGREVRSNGCNWPILCVSQQTVYVAGQTGGGAHCMVPQNKDCIIQSVQTILHSRLGGPEGLKSEELGRGEERKRGTEQLSISTLGQKLKTLIVWCGLKKKQKTSQTQDKEDNSNARSTKPFQLEL